MIYIIDISGIWSGITLFSGARYIPEIAPQLCPLLNMANLELGGIAWYGVEVHTRVARFCGRGLPQVVITV